MVIIVCITFSAVMYYLLRRAQAEHAAKQIEAEKEAQQQQRILEQREQAFRLADAEIEKARQQKDLERKAAEDLKRNLATRDLQYKMKVCENDHKAIVQCLENLSVLHELANAELDAAERAGDDRRKAIALKKVVSLDKQIAAAEKKELKIRYDWNTAKMKLA